MDLSVVEPWVRFLRSVFATGRGGTKLTTPVQVSTGFPFTDIPQNSNLPNDPALAGTSSYGAVRVPWRRSLTPPEITVHDGGATFPKRYMDNFISFMYSHDVPMPPELKGKVSRIKNVLLELPNGTLRVLRDGDHYVYDRQREAITFHVEYFSFVPTGTKLKYVANLFSETACGPMEIISEGVVCDGEVIGAIYSMESDVNLQIDLWGGDQKQTEWMLQRFRNLWINEKKLRQALASYGLISMNLNWSHGGIVKSFDEKLRPYLYNVSCSIRFTTEFRVLELAQEFLGTFEAYSGTNWLGGIVPSFEGVAMREYVGSLVIEPFRVRFMVPWGNSRKDIPGHYGINNTLGQIDFKPKI